jgi:hypothetical protein
MLACLFGSWYFEIHMMSAANFLAARVHRNAMSRSAASQNVEVEFIRLLFTDPVEEEIAYRWALRLAGLVGRQVLRLRPQTTLAEMLKWAALVGADSMDFAVVFEPEPRMDLAEFLEYSEHATFREMVQHYAKRFGR